MVDDDGQGGEEPEVLSRRPVPDEPDVDRIELFAKESIDQHPHFVEDGPDKPLFDAIEERRLVVFFGAGITATAKEVP